MDAFFASVAQLDNPLLRNQPIAVGYDGKGGVIAAASYEARAFGVKSAMSSVIAKRRCPHLIFVKPDFKRYQEISKKIRSIFETYTHLVEPLSLDEAYLDVTTNKKEMPSATIIAQQIRNEIYTQTGLCASAGIGPNKFIAKIASDVNKPNGQKTVAPEEVLDFIASLPIHKFYGVGKVTTQKMYQLGIFTGLDLRNQSLAFLERNFKNSGQYYFDIARGIHHGAVKPSRQRKSVGVEHTYAENVISEVFASVQLELLAKELAERMLKAEVSAKTLVLKIKYSDFVVQTRSISVINDFTNAVAIFELAKTLLFREKLTNSIRLLGLSAGNLAALHQRPSKESQQLTIGF